MSIIDFLIKLLNNKLELIVPMFSLAYTTEEVSSEKLSIELKHTFVITVLLWGWAGNQLVV